MPIYEYEHKKGDCSIGKTFDFEQSVKDKPLTKCPNCGGAVKKIISLSSINTPKTNSELRNLGFTKLVKRDEGIYENVTARRGESKVMERGKPETIPDFSKTIKD